VGESLRAGASGNRLVGLESAVTIGRVNTVPVGRVDMQGKVCLVTGANSGIGKATALGLAEMGARVVMVCRDRARGTAARDEIRSASGNDSVELLVADLASLGSVRKLAEHFVEAHERLHVLINNAAVLSPKRMETEDGFEMQFGVNHLAPFMLTNLLLERLKASGSTRVVNVSSMAHRGAKIDFEDLQSEKRYKMMRAYGQSKLGNVLFTYALAKRLAGTGVTANSLHPGIVRTGIFRDFPGPVRGLEKILGGLILSTPTKGTKTSLYVATSPEIEGIGGKYFEKCREAESSAESHDEAVAERLWSVSAAMTGCGQ